MKFFILLSLLFHGCISSPKISEQYLHIVDYESVISPEGFFTMVLDSPPGKTQQGIYLFESLFSGECNPLCPGICHNGKCMTSIVDENYLEDASDGVLSKSRESKSISIAITVEDNQLKLKIPDKSFKPNTIYELLITPGLKNINGFPIVSPLEEKKPFVILFETTSSSFEAAPLKIIWPQNYQKETPQNLGWILVETDEDIHSSANAGDFYLESSEGRIIELVPEQKSRQCTSWCKLFWVGDFLDSKTEYALMARENTFVPSGKIIPSWKPLAHFTTGDLQWSWSPEFSEIQTQAVTGCMHLNGKISGEALLWIDNMKGMMLPSSLFRDSIFELAAPESGLWRINWLSAGGESGIIDTVEVQSSEYFKKSVAITGIYPNAIGPEPANEFIIIENVSSSIVNLENWRITDSLEKTGDLLPDYSLLPGDEIYITGDGFDLESADGELIGSNATIISVRGTLLSSGMTNTGETVYLFNDEDQIVSRYGGWIDASEKPGIEIQRIFPDGCDVKYNWKILE
ncbi:MAG: lamin tail domain-containing protein [Deltaproteobacteria bacterium]|nr:lamin tail domain-containing protein [Deltaproteobacteria bacterium]